MSDVKFVEFFIKRAIVLDYMYEPVSLISRCVFNMKIVKNVAMKRSLTHTYVLFVIYTETGQAGYKIAGL